MVVSYDKLWRLLAQRKLNKRDLVRLSGISISTMWFSEEQLADGYRLGCQVYTKGPTTVDISVKA